LHVKRTCAISVLELIEMSALSNEKFNITARRRWKRHCTIKS